MRAVTTAAAYHDLGKVEDIKQAVLGSDSKRPLPGVPHEEAGIARLISTQINDEWAAALVAAHHQGLFDGKEQRGRRGSQENPPVFRKLDPDCFDHVDLCLDRWLQLHEADGAPAGSPQSSCPPDPVTLRLALSCLVDADHSDTANHQWGTQDPPRPRRRWRERLAQLVATAREKPKATDRDLRRQKFFDSCLGVGTESRILSCVAPVGSGKTFAVMAHLLNVARARGLRHIFVVLPYTNIITQAVKEYRAALTLPGEDPEEVVAELHHQADFETLQARQLAALWRAPVIVTTAVAFFETLAGAKPGRLRKMHELPGSAIFIDEAHAALPHHLWPLAWLWLETLCDRWRMHAVLGSGSLFRFWEQPGFLTRASTRPVPELTPEPVLTELRHSESKRVQPRREPMALTADDLANKVRDREGPSVVVLNTVRSAASVAVHLRDNGFDTLHLSTALAPMHRKPIIEEIERRLREEPSRSWVLVATSCIEAGLDFSFRRGYREAASVASLLQLGGRVRRNEEPWEGELVSFSACGPGITAHPQMKESAAVLDLLLRDGEFGGHNDPSTLLKMAFARSLQGKFREARDELHKLEGSCRFPCVQEKFKVIDADTRLVVVEPSMIRRLEAGHPVRFSELVRASVQIYASRLGALPCRVVRGLDEVWTWSGIYCPHFLGYLASQEAIDALYAAGGAVV